MYLVYLFFYRGAIVSVIIW